MHHTSARIAISRILEGSGFGERALALATAAALGDADEQAAELRQAALQQAALLEPDPLATPDPRLISLPLPTTDSELCRQIMPALIADPRDTGMGLALLVALVQLWPHVGSDERPLMRLRLLTGLAALHAPDGAGLPPSQLSAWQRDMPTSPGETLLTVASLKSLLAQDTPREAYRVIADHLGTAPDFPTLAWALGALTVQTRLQFHDPHCQLLHVLSGTVALERLCAWAAPEHLASVTVQVAHQLWWCRHRAMLAPIRQCLDRATPSLAEAVAAGDLTLAQRAARVAGKEAGNFWEASWRLLAELIAARDLRWSTAMIAITATAWRTSADAISPDDAALVGTVLADLAYREKSGPVLAVH